ncbi:MAG: HAD family hydrolase [Chloroflexi bacterium]|nr:HAD family hydrolase [Chloroflexota bacterium]
MMSHREYVLHVVRSLEIDDMIDVIVSAEDVSRGKPDPQPYLLAAEKLGVSPQKCLVLEDSVNGVRSARAAGMHVVAIATAFTHAGLHADELVDDCWIVHDPENLAREVQARIALIDTDVDNYGTQAA